MARNVYQYEQPRCPDNWNEAERRFYNRLIETLDDIYAKYGRLDAKMLAKSVIERIDTSTATALETMVADIVTSGKIAADSIEATFAYAVSLSAKYGSFDFETVKNLVADAMVLEKGQADYVHITNFAATYAQAVNATIGNLVIQSSDGQYYQLDVSSDGKVSAEPVEVSDGEIAAGETESGKVIVGTHIAAETLGTETLAATQALINMLDAARINVDTLIAREEFVQTLTASEAFINSLVANSAFIKVLGTTTIVGDKSLVFIAGEASDAKNLANAAQSAASNAQSTADSANSAANAANTAASNAQSAANSANSAASNAQSTANAAQSAANNARASADNLDRLTDIEVIEGTFVQTTRREGEGIHIFSEFGPKQDKTYGDPYPGGAGKNLCPDILNSDSPTYAGVTLSVENGKFKLSGTATAGGGRIILRTIAFNLPAGTYRISSDAPFAGTPNVQILIHNASDNSILTDRQNFTFTLANDTDVYVGVGILTDNVYNETFYIQIEAGSTATSYAPYTNTPPIEGWTGLNAGACGGNLLPNTAKSQTINGVTFTVNADGSITANGTATADAEIIVYNVNTDADDYTGCVLSGCPAGGGGSTYFVRYANKSGSVNNDYGAGVVITGEYTGAAAVIVRIRTGVVASNLIFKPMIRLASDPDATYTPYTGKTYALDFGETIFGGTVDWNAGEMTVEWGEFIDYANMLYNSPNNAGDGNIFYMPGEYVEDVVMSSILKNQKRSTGVGAWESLNVNAVRTSPTNLIVCVPISITNTDELAAYMEGQQIVYKLAEPYTIQLTPVQLETLKGINTVYTDADDGRVEFGHDPLANTVDTLEGTVRDVQATANDALPRVDFQRVVRIDDAGLHVGDNQSNGEVLIDSESVNVVLGGQKYSRFAANYVQFGNYQLRRTADGGLAFKVR